MKGTDTRGGRPLLDPSIRSWARVLLVCCAALVVLLGVLFAHQASADPFDRAADAPVIAWLRGHGAVTLWIATRGLLISVAALTAATAAGCLLARRLNGAVLAVVALPVAVGLDEKLIKPLAHRTALGGLSYPSGHTTAVFTVAVTLTVLVILPPRPARARRLAVLAVSAEYALGIIMALAVMALRWHYFTDTVAGAAVAAGTVCGLALLLDLPAVARWLAWPGGRGPGGSTQAGPGRARWGSPLSQAGVGLDDEDAAAG